MKHRRLLTALAFLAFISLGLPDGVLGVAWPSVRRSFQLPLSQLGLLLASSVIGYFISSFSSGQIVRRIGVGRLLVLSSALVVIALTGNALAPAWAVMIACGFIGGLGSGAIDAGINAFAAARFSAKIVTWVHACYGIGATLGPLLMTVILEKGMVWRWGYGMLSAILALMGVLFILTHRWWDDGAADPHAPQHPSAGMLATLRLPMVWLHIGLFIIYCGIEVTAGQWLFSLLVESRQIERAVAGTIVSAYWGALTAGRIAFGLAAERFPRRSILRLATAVVPLAAGMIWYSGSPPVSFAGAILLGLVLAPVYPLLISATPDRVGAAHAPNAIGFEVSAATLGIAIIPGIAGVLARRLGLEIIGPYLLIHACLLLILHEMTLLQLRCASVPAGVVPQPSA